MAVYIWRAPLTGREIGAVTDDLDSPLREVVVTSRSFGEAAGGLAVGFLIGFVVVSALGAWAVWRRQPVTATVVAVAGLLLCLVTAFSIGSAFWLSAWCLLGAALICWLAREASR